MWKRLLGDFLSPPSCASCDSPTPSVFCAACAITVERCPSDESLFAYAAFGGAIAVAIRRFKYEDRPDLAHPLSELLRSLCRHSKLQADVVIPVPLHPLRLAERGYNQASLLARAIARETGARFQPRALVRIADTPRQAELAREARFQNVANAFAVRKEQAIAGRHILLVDDVSTTGATLDACRKALEPSRPRSVRSIVLARTLTE